MEPSFNSDGTAAMASYDRLIMIGKIIIPKITEAVISDLADAPASPLKKGITTPKVSLITG